MSTHAAIPKIWRDMFRSLLALLLLVLLPPHPCSAGESDKVPPIELPPNLRAYADDGAVTKTATGIIGLLATAKFDEPSENGPFNKPPCNAPDVVSFYQGMTLMQVSYFMFISKMERGFESSDSPHSADVGSLIKPGGELLVGVWDRNKLMNLLSLVSTVRGNPHAVNADLASYFGTLLEFGERYDALKRRASNELAQLNRRTTLLYKYEPDDALAMAKEQGETALLQAQWRYPEHLWYFDYSKEMRQLLNANRDIGQKPVGECLDGGLFTAVHIGSNAEITYGPGGGLYPASHMVGFWQRREFEGTTAITRFAIGRLLAELKR